MSRTDPSEVSYAVIDAAFRAKAPVASTPPGAAAYANRPSGLIAIDSRSAVGAQWPIGARFSASKA